MLTILLAAATSVQAGPFHKKPCDPCQECPPAESAAEQPAESAPSPTPAPAAEAPVGFAPIADAVAFTAGASAANTPIIGRIDTNLRFNSFDNMSALPKSRLWMSYQYASEVGNPAHSGASTIEGDVNIYRQGLEVALS